jgi:hypothetical protein
MQLVLSSFLVGAAQAWILCSLERQPACRRGGRLGWGFVADRVASPRLLLLGIALLMAVAAGSMSLFTTAWPVGAIAAVVILLGATASGWNGVFLAERDVRRAEVDLATSGSLMFTFSASYSDPRCSARWRAPSVFRKHISSWARPCCWAVFSERSSPEASRTMRKRDSPIYLVDFLSPGTRSEKAKIAFRQQDVRK